MCSSDLIIENLASAGFSSSDVTKVLMSHLHRDHAGGLIIKDTFSKKLFLTFPNANHYINQSELAFAQSGMASSYDPAYFSFFSNNEKVILTSGDGKINDQISFKMSSGHSPFHQVFWIAEKDQTIFFGGDEAPQLQQMRTRFVAKYDAEIGRAHV